jgi:hypothetical protein
MPKFLVSGYLTVSVFAVIEAATPEEAKAKAENLAAPSLCHACENAGGGDHEWTLNGFDDPPEDAVHDVQEADDQ